MAMFLLPDAFSDELTRANFDVLRPYHHQRLVTLSCQSRRPWRRGSGDPTWRSPTFGTRPSSTLPTWPATPPTGSTWQRPAASGKPWSRASGVSPGGRGAPPLAQPSCRMGSARIRIIGQGIEGPSRGRDEIGLTVRLEKGDPVDLDIWGTAYTFSATTNHGRSMTAAEAQTPGSNRWSGSRTRNRRLDGAISRADQDVCRRHWAIPARRSQRSCSCR